MLVQGEGEVLHACMGVFVCVCVCVCACVHAYACVCVCVHVHVPVSPRGQPVGSVFRGV